MGFPEDTRTSNPAPKGRMRKLPALKALAKVEREAVLDLVDAIDPTSRGNYQIKPKEGPGL